MISPTSADIQCFRRSKEQALANCASWSMKLVEPFSRVVCHYPSKFKMYVHLKLSIVGIDTTKLSTQVNTTGCTKCSLKHFL